MTVQSFLAPWCYLENCLSSSMITRERSSPAGSLPSLLLPSFSQKPENDVISWTSVQLSLRTLNVNSIKGTYPKGHIVSSGMENYKCKVKTSSFGRSSALFNFIFPFSRQLLNAYYEPLVLSPALFLGWLVYGGCSSVCLVVVAIILQCWEL
jgi:hypothetical protein